MIAGDEGPEGAGVRRCAECGVRMSAEGAELVREPWLQLMCCTLAAGTWVALISERKVGMDCVKTKDIGLVMTESGLRRCGPVCGVRECEVQGLVQRTELRGVRKVCAELGEWYGDRRSVRRYRIEEWVRGSRRALASTYI